MSEWTEERTKVAKRMWFEGKSGGIIEKALHRMGASITRSGITGKASRDKWPRPKGATANDGGATRRLAMNAEPRRSSGQSLPPLVRVEVPDDIAKAPKPILERGKLECSWIIGPATADALCCCNPVDEERSPMWCKGHWRRGHSQNPVQSSSQFTRGLRKHFA